MYVANLLLDRLPVNVVFVFTKGIVNGPVVMERDGVVDDNKLIFVDVNEIK